MFQSYYLLPLLLPLLFLKGDFAQWLFKPLGRWLDAIGARPWRAVVFVGIASLLVCAGLTLATGVPVPKVEDEFGYLLQGDTFAHWRVTNPTPPFWEHFETLHEIMRPTYTAKFPPAQGVALAAGQLLGLPIIGVWATAALACAAICWMLMAWAPTRWAIAGGLLAAFHPQVIEWSQDYWGGAVAMGASVAHRRCQPVRPRPSRAGGGASGPGAGNPGQQPPLRGIRFQSPGPRRPLVVVD